MPKQSRLSLLTKSIIWTLFIIAWVTSPASALEDSSESPLSPIEFTDVEFETKVKEYLGIPYRPGGTTKKGMDCSGFVRTVYDNLFGIELPPSSVAQFRFSGLEKIDTSEMQSGDLIFFANGKKKRINHVGVYISDRQFIHASSTQGITVSSLDERYWSKRFVGSKRHKELSFRPDEDDIQFEGSLEIPVHETGMVSFYSWNALDFTGFSEQDDLGHGSFKIHDLDFSLLYFNELSYEIVFLDDFSLNMSGFHERFEGFTYSPDHGGETTAYLEDGYFYDTAERLGFKLASDYQPVSWFSITPSVTYFDYSNQDLLNAAKWSLGVNTHVSPLHQRWSLSMRVQYSERDDVTTIASPYSKFSSLDMAIKLGINLTDNLQFSIMGLHDKRLSAYSMQQDSLLNESSINDVFMTFNFRY